MSIDLAWNIGPSSPSLQYASTLVPKPYPEVWKWFMEHEGESWDRLPHHTSLGDGGSFRVAGVPISRDAGIYRPGNDYISWSDRVAFALSVHNSRNSGYRDIPPLYLGDGTWIIKYCQHATGADRSEAKGQKYNFCLLNCLEYGVPVGVIFSDGGPYKIMGLAFVERYDPLNGVFTLHGPVRSDNVGKGLFEEFVHDDGCDLPNSGAHEIEQIKYEMRKRREGQADFRKRLLSAYDGACAATGTDVIETLQAAHIENYNGPKSQQVYNGILLRSDVHLLFDAHMLTVDPSNMRFVISDQLEGTTYEYLAGRALRLPRDPALRPRESLLDIHYCEFKHVEIVRCA